MYLKIFLQTIYFLYRLASTRFDAPTLCSKTGKHFLTMISHFIVSHYSSAFSKTSNEAALNFKILSLTSIINFFFFIINFNLKYCNIFTSINFNATYVKIYIFIITVNISSKVISFTWVKPQ